MISSKLRERDRDFMRGGDLDLVRRRREESQVELRKAKRSEIAAKRRALASLFTPHSDQPAFEFSSSIYHEKLSVPISILEEAKLSPHRKAQTAIGLLRSGNSTDRPVALSTLRRILATEDTPIVAIANLGVVPLLLNVLRAEYEEEVVLESVWCLANLTAGPSEVIAKLVDLGGLLVLHQLLSHANTDIRDQAIWTLSNIAGDSVSHRDEVISLGIVEILSNLLVSGKAKSSSSIEVIAWLLSNLCRGVPEPPTSVVSTALKLAPGLLATEKARIVATTCWMLSCLTDNRPLETVDAVLNSGVIGTLLEWVMRTEAEKVQIPALRTLGNILTGDDSQAQVLLNLGLLQHLAALIGSDKREVRREVLWCFSNITAGPEEQAMAVAKHNCVHSIVEALSDSDFGVKKEAVWTIAHLTRFLDCNIYDGMINSGVLELMVRILDHQDAEILLLALESISRLLTAHSRAAIPRFEALQGFDRLEFLRDHSNIAVHEKAGELIREFTGQWDLPDRMDLQDPPETAFQFS